MGLPQSTICEEKCYEIVGFLKHVIEIQVKQVKIKPSLVVEQINQSLVITLLK